MKKFKGKNWKGKLWQINGTRSTGVAPQEPLPASSYRQHRRQHDSRRNESGMHQIPEAF